MHLQRKIAIAAADDPLEREADRIADQVLVAPAHAATSASLRSIQRYSPHAATDALTVPPRVERVLAGPGRPLDAPLRRDMERRFGYDFSQVRVHTGGDAEQSARVIGAHAYTAGHHVVFGMGRYAPSTYGGRRLIAHELTHVVQQSSARMPCVQRQPYWALRGEGNYGLGSGTLSHNHAFMRMRRNNPNLFTDVPVFGATAGGLEEGAVGYADLFAASGLIGVQFDDTGRPVFPFTSKRTYYGQSQLSEINNRQLAQPAANRGSTCCGSVFVRGIYGICRLDRHELIGIGELKPMNSAEEVLGTPQVTAYRDAFRLLRERINQYVVANPAMGDPPGVRWQPPIDLIEDEALVPPDLRHPQSTTEWPVEIVEYSASGRPTGQYGPGTMQVRYRSPGILGYRWIPLDELEKREERRRERRKKVAQAAAAAITASVVALGLVAKRRQAQRVAAGASDDIKLLKEYAKKGAVEKAEAEAKARAELAAIKKGEKTLVQKGGERLGKRALGKVLTKGNQALLALSAISAAYLLASGEARADPLGGDDPLVAAIKAARQQGEPVPEQLRALIEADEELRRLATEAAASGGMDAAQRAAADRAAQLLAENIDQFSDEEIAALLAATGAASHDAPLLDPTLEQLKAAAAQRGVGAEAEAVAGPARAGAPARLAGATENVQRLWDAVTGAEGVVVDAAFAERFQAELEGDLTDEELAALFEALTKSEGEVTDPELLLERLRDRLAAMRDAATPGGNGDSRSAEGVSKAPKEGAAVPGDDELAEGTPVEREEPALAEGLDGEAALESLRAELSALPASAWPAPGRMQLHRPRVAPGAEGLPTESARLFAATANGEPCLQYLEVRNAGPDAIEVIAVSPLACRQGAAFATLASLVKPGERYRVSELR